MDDHKQIVMLVYSWAMSSTKKQFIIYSYIDNNSQKLPSLSQSCNKSDDEYILTSILALWDADEGYNKILRIR